MAEVEQRALQAIQDAYEEERSDVLMTHGSSTSVGWRQTTARSVIRGLTRSKVATP